MSFAFPYWIEYVVWSAIIAVLFAWLQARSAAKRQPLLDFSKIQTNYAWRYVDLKAPYGDVFATCEQIARSVAKDDPEGILAIGRDSGVIIVERPIAFRTPDNEVNFRLDRYFSFEPGNRYEITRVQVLSRALTSWRSPDPKVVKQIIEALKSKYSWITDGPELAPQAPRTSP